jgi:cytochrome c oxidase subunit II
MRRLLTPATALLAAAVAGACRGVQPMLAPGGPEARELAHLGWFVLLVFSLVTVIMSGLIFWVATRRRGTLAEHAPWDAPNDKRWIVVGGFSIPTVILAIIFVLTLKTMAAYPIGDHEMRMPAADIAVTGHQWWWEIEYRYGSEHQRVVTANELHIPAGKPVDIELTTRDVIHSFWIPRLHGKVDLVPGFPNRIRLQADAPGLYRGECGEYCGPQHAHMILLVQADSQTDFDNWLTAVRKVATEPSDALARRGEQVFMTSPCVTCHTIRGTSAQGLVGPDLTHIGARKAIAANTYPNGAGYLDAWVTHAQEMKPGAQMPDIGGFSGDDLQALTHYLEGLK